MYKLFIFPPEISGRGFITIKLSYCFRDMTTMFIDAIEFLNNVGDIHKALTNVKENNVDPSKLIQAVVNTGNYSNIGNKNIFEYVYIFHLF
jgi:hypothetical protein